jgi:hypothetical protein
MGNGLDAVTSSMVARVRVVGPRNDSELAIVSFL